MSGSIRFEFGAAEERDEFLLLNDLRLSGNSSRLREVLDLEGHVVGNAGDGFVEILEPYRNAVRPAQWWLASPEQSPPPPATVADESDELSLGLMETARRRLSGLYRRTRVSTT
jgi:hypothetical protein